MLQSFLILLLGLISTTDATTTPYTSRHESGYCALYGIGGKETFIDIPEPNNVPARKLSTSELDELVDICGESWTNVDTTCCNIDQIHQLQQNLDKARPLISSCPACQENFFQMFCHFTCSPNQSTFMNVTKVGTSLTGNNIVNELDFYINDDDFSSTFYDSCKSIKFGATNGYAMDLIGGGARNYTEFLKFLGDKKPMLGGSPFQINFKYGSNFPMKPLNISSHPCNDKDPKFRCSCSDCPEICPALSPLKRDQQCMIGHLPCFSFTVLICYFGVTIAYIFIFLLVRKQDENILFKIFQREAPLLTDDNTSIENSLHHQDTVNETPHNSLESEIDTTGSIYSINNFLEQAFYQIGYTCSKFPWLVIGVCVSIAIALGAFTVKVEIETDPVNLWVSPEAEAFKQKQIFDSEFGPFYRTEQLFVSNTSGESVFQNYDFIEWWFSKEREIQEITVNTSSHSDIKYSDLCLKPTGDACVLESFTQYFNGDVRFLPRSSWKQKIQSCAASPVSCLPSFQQPLSSSLLFGTNESNAVLDAPAFVVTLVSNNDADKSSDYVQSAVAWEEQFEEYVTSKLIPEARKWKVNISFSSEISVEKELNKSNNTDGRIIVFSYLAMFAYISLALGGFNPGKSLRYDNDPANLLAAVKRLLLKTRFGLGLSGISIVLLSVISSVGICSIFNLKSTLIIAEVIPFLVLAIGVDNIFLIYNELCEMNYSFESWPVEKRMAKTLSNVGPSIILSASCELCCFILASFVDMPAVRNFAIYSTLAIFINTILQLTAFISILTLDQKRIEDKRLDLLPFIRVDEYYHDEIVETDSLMNTNNQRNAENSADDNIIQVTNGTVGSLLSRYLAPFLFDTNYSKFVLTFFTTWFMFSLAALPAMKLGLDQRLAMPQDSHLIEYFDDMYEYLNVGPPIYWVVDGVNASSRDGQRSLCGRFTTCDSTSLVNILQQEYKRSDESTIAQPVASWIDDFLLWLNPDLASCCRVKKTASKIDFGASKNEVFCEPWQSSRQCESCFENRKWKFDMSGFPEGDDFNTYLDEWIKSPSDMCALGGKAPYSNSLYIRNGDVIRSAFRNSHKQLHSQDDFINAYHSSLKITKEIKKEQSDLNVFAYSPFYIFFVQYETIINLSMKLIGTGLLIIFCISGSLLGCTKNGMVLTITALFILVDVAASMTAFNVSLNAVSLVNLMICLGLAVEFSVHMVRYFNFCTSTMIHESNHNILRGTWARAYESFCFIGGTTLSGITLTKLIGISVLGFTTSKIFQVYYFRMWMSLIVISSLHALLFLPVVLGYFGSKNVYRRSKAFIENGTEDTEQ